MVCLARVVASNCSWRVGTAMKYRVDSIGLLLLLTLVCVGIGEGYLVTLQVFHKCINRINNSRN